MVRIEAACVLILGLVGGAVGSSPVQKVVELLEENRGKVVADLEAEAKEMEEYSTFCDDELSEKGYAIKDATRKIADLEATIQNGDAQVLGFKDEISTLGTEMAAQERKLVAATEVRKKEKADFDKVEKELMTAVDQLDRAVVIIKREMSFVQTKGSKGSQKQPRKDIKLALSIIGKMIDAAWVTSGTKKSLQGFLQAQTDAGADGELTLKQPQATVTAYESHSGGIVEQIEEMKSKAESTLTDTRRKEQKENHGFEMIAQNLNNGITILKEKLGDAKSSMASTTEETGKAKGELEETKKAKAADETYSATLKQECAATAVAWADRQKDAKGELAAIDKAKEILVDRVKVFVQFGKTSSRSHGDIEKDLDDDDTADDKQTVTRKRLTQKLKELSHKFNSYALLEMAGAAGADPFGKVRGLIEEMIAKLISEANQEATQKAFCDEETSKSKASQTEKTMAIDKLTSRIDKAATTKAELEQKIKDLEAEIASIDKATSEATKIRTEESATNTKSAADFKQAAEAVTEAIGVLKEYYEGALVQTGNSQKGKQPEFGGAKSDAASSIISILEMSAEDFTKLLMETTTEEEEAAAEYKKLMDESTVSKASKQAEVKGAISEIKSLDVALKNSGEDKAMTQSELDAVMSYLEKLKPQCETKAMSYEEKVARREAEIEGLKEALSILDGSAPAMLVQTQLHLRGAK